MSQSNEQSEIGKMQRGCGAWHGHECARTRYRVFGAGGSRRRHVAPPCHVELPRHITYYARATQKHIRIRSRQAGSAGHSRHQHGFDVHASRTGSMATRTVLPRPQVGAERQRRVTPCAQTRPSAEKVSYCITSTGAALRACTSPVYSSSSNPDECMCYIAQMT